IEEGGKRVPHDVAVIGYDDTYLAAVAKPALTSVAQPAHEMGEAAVRILMERLRGGRTKPREVLLEQSLSIRDTCGANPQGPFPTPLPEREALRIWIALLQETALTKMTKGRPADAPSSRGTRRRP